MSSSLFRRPLALAATVVVGASIVLGGAGVANASHAGNGSGLLAGSTGASLVFPDGHKLNWSAGVNGASWSPDGSRAVFVQNDGAIRTVRHNEPTTANPRRITSADGIQRSHPTWRGWSGFGIAWSEYVGGQWTIAYAASTPFCCVASSDLDEFGAYDTVPALSGYNDTNPDGGDSNLIVFQRQSTGGGTPAVWVHSSFPADTHLVVSNAAQPSISPDGNRVAFVRVVDGSSLVFTTNMSGGDLVQVTTAGAGTVTHTNPTWSPDGQTIAFNTSATAVATAPADGSAAPAASTITGVPAYQPQAENLVARLAGSSRFGTAGAVSQAQWKSYGDDSDQRQQAQSVVLSRSDNFADALGGATLAAAKQGPLLLTLPTKLNPITKAEIERVLAPGGTIYVLGGTGAVSTAVENELKASGYLINRRSGANRYATSVSIADAVMDNVPGGPRNYPTDVFVATGVNFPDALAAGAAAGSYNAGGTGGHAVILLTQDSKLPTATADYLSEWQSATADYPWAIGGQAAQALYWNGYYEIVGSNRYETSLLVAHWFFGGNSVAGVATGTNWPDALAGGALMATLNGPLLLTPGTSTTLSPYTAFALDGSSGSFSTAFIFGGTGAVNGALVDQAGNLISGPAGFSFLTVTESGSLTGAATLRSTAGNTLRPTNTTGEKIGTNPKASKEIQAKPELHPAAKH